MRLKEAPARVMSMPSRVGAALCLPLNRAARKLCCVLLHAARAVGHHPACMPKAHAKDDCPVPIKLESSVLSGVSHLSLTTRASDSKQGG